MDADYNLSTLVADVKDELQDQSYDDNRIIRYINETYFETFGEVPYSFFEKTYNYETEISIITHHFNEYGVS